MKTTPVLSATRLFLAARVLLAAISAPALAMSSNFPDVRPGFGALSSKGLGGGKVSARHFGENCSGWINDSPDHYITVRAPVKMRLRARLTSASANLTLVVRMTGGRALCAATSADGTRPEISAEFPVGQYEVFVGSVEKNRYGDYTLRIHEDSEWKSLHEGYKNAGSGNFKRLQPGFGLRRSEWDYIKTEMDARSLGNGCVGWIGTAPNHLMTVRSPVKMSVRAFRGYNLADPVLLIKTPDGRVLCDDNSIDGINPEISGEFPAGTYEVFVGGLEKDRAGDDYSLIVTEDRDAPPSAHNSHTDD